MNVSFVSGLLTGVTKDVHLNPLRAWVHGVTCIQANSLLWHSFQFMLKPQIIGNVSQLSFDSNHFCEFAVVAAPGVAT